MTNKQIYEIIKKSPNYKNWTPMVSVEVFTREGFKGFYENALPQLLDFFGLMIQVVLNKIKDVNVRIPEFYKAIVEEQAMGAGGILQRIYNTIPKPISPQYLNLQEGSWVNDYVIRKTEQFQMFFKQNFPYSNLITIPEDMLQKAFVNENGVAEFVAQKQAALQKSYYIEKTKLAKVVLAGALRGDGITAPALKDTQIYDVTKIPNFADIDSDTPINMQAAWREFANVLDNIATMMATANTIGTLNAEGWEDGAYEKDHILLVKGTLINKLKKFDGLLGNGTGYLTDIFKNIPFKVVEIDMFEPTYVLASDNSVELKPVYSNKVFQDVIGFNTTGGEGTKEDCLADSEIQLVDKQDDTFAALVQKGLILAAEQSPYKVRIKQSYLGNYMNMIATQPNGLMGYDSHYNLVKFTKAVSNP